VQPANSSSAAFYERYLPWFLAALCCWVIFQNLGTAHLFEPDEGRNAERGRELLLLNDWVIPHENFVPALNKPIFLYWLIAIAYKLFGVSEWSARLPSALAALGCLFLIYGFVRERWGACEAAWSALILLTNIQFFLYSRIVIFDMTLTFFTTLSLVEFQRALEAVDAGPRRLHGALMCAGMGLATLVKGPIGALIPGMIISLHLLFRREWSFLAWRNLMIGAVVFCAIVAPWAAWTETRHPGYLRYFLWEENVLRFLTPHFQRSQPWYFYFLVVVFGFFPWSFLLPSAIKDIWNKRPARDDLLLLLWIVVPFLFFSASHSKLPHYILPIFPALAVLTAKAVNTMNTERGSARRGAFALPWLALFIAVFYLMIGAHWPALLHHDIRETIVQMSPSQNIANIVIIFVSAGFAFSAAAGLWKDRRIVYLYHGLGMALFLFFVAQIFASASHTRSAKTLAERTVPFLQPQSRLVFYDSYLTSMPFYLRVASPIWVIWSGRNKIVMQNTFIAEKQPRPAAGFGQVLFTFEEFSEEWKAAKQPLLVFLKQRQMARLLRQGGDTPRELTTVGEFILVSNR